MPDSEGFKTAQNLKDEGNAQFRQKDYGSAHRSYENAIAVLQREKENAETRRLHAILASNSSACMLGLKQYSTAMEKASLAIKIDPGYSKGWARLAKAQQNQSDYHLRAMVTWEHALESLDPTDMKLKDEYESELEGARELSISALELKDISSQPIGDDSPSDRVLCMPSVAQRLPSELVAGIQLSSASRLLAAYQTFQTGTLLMSRRKAESPVFNMPSPLGLITNGVLLDPRVFEGVNDRWIKMWKEQILLEARAAHIKPYGWQKNSLDFFHEQFAKKLGKNGWTYTRLAFSTLVCTWITIAMVDRKEHRRVTDRSLILLIKTLSLLGWGRKTWYLVLRDQRGEVLDSEFTRMVNSLKMEFTMQAYSENPGPQSSRHLDFIPAALQSIIADSKNNNIIPEKPRHECSLGYFMGAVVYPIANSFAMVGFYYAAEATEGLGSPQEIRQKYKQAGEWYMRAADRYPKNDELFIWSLKSAFDNISKASSSPYRTVLKILEDIRQAAPEVQKIWENSAMARDGRLSAVSLQTIATTETELRKTIRAGNATLDTIYITGPGNEATDTASNGQLVHDTAEPVMEDSAPSSKTMDHDLPSVVPEPQVETTPSSAINEGAVLDESTLVEEQDASTHVEAMPLPTLAEEDVPDAAEEEAVLEGTPLPLGDRAAEDSIANVTGPSTGLGDAHSTDNAPTTDDTGSTHPIVLEKAQNQPECLPSDSLPVSMTTEDVSEAPAIPMANEEVYERASPQVETAEDNLQASLTADEPIQQPQVLSEQAEGAPSAIAERVENHIIPEAASTKDLKDTTATEVDPSEQTGESDAVHDVHDAVPAVVEPTDNADGTENIPPKKEEEPVTQAPMTSSTDLAALISPHSKEAKSDETSENINSSLPTAGAEPFSDDHQETEASKTSEQAADELPSSKGVHKETSDAAVISDVVHQESDATRNQYNNVLVGEAAPPDTGDHALEQVHGSPVVDLPVKSGAATVDSEFTPAHVAAEEIQSHVGEGETATKVGEDAPVESTHVPLPAASEAPVTQEPTLSISHIDIPTPSSNSTSVPTPAIGEKPLAAEQTPTPPIPHLDIPSPPSNLNTVPTPATDEVDSTQASPTSDPTQKSKAGLGSSFSKFGKKMGKMFRKQND